MEMNKNDERWYQQALLHQVDRARRTTVVGST
jgi:hypothetical protein